MFEELRGIRIELEQKDLTVDQSATAAVSLENMNFRSGVFASHFPAEGGSSALRKSRATSQLMLHRHYTHYAEILVCVPSLMICSESPMPITHDQSAVHVFSSVWQSHDNH
jgi:hypothetical protein